MAVGLRIAGFSPAQLYEANEFCCETLQRNSAGEKATLLGNVVQGEAEAVDWRLFRGKVRLLAAGAPCQPFSLGGKHHAQRDERNLFPEVMRAVRETRPIAVLIENVRGIVRHSFRFYFEYIVRQLQFPSIAPRANERWQDHNKRLQKMELTDDPEYNVVFRVVDAADFGVPQNRMRVFVVATRADFPTYTFPKRTHSRQSLEDALRSKNYWERHGLKRPRNRLATASRNSQPDGLLPWTTVRDALVGLPDPASVETEADMNHWTIQGARSYNGHTGSQLDWTAKTIKAGVHGVPGGENTVNDETGRLRYLTLRETARLQTLPDRHVFVGRRTHVTRQIGNAVPSQLAAAIAAPLHDLIGLGLAKKSRTRR